MGKIREYTQVALAKLTDLFVIDRNESGVHTTNSVSVEQVGDAIFSAKTAGDLPLGNTTPSGSTAEAIANKASVQIGQTSGTTTTITFDITLGASNLGLGYLILAYRTANENANDGTAIIKVYNSVAYILKKTGASSLTAVSFDSDTSKITITVGNYMTAKFIQ